MQRKRVIKSLAGLAALALPATAVVSLGGVAHAATGVYLNSGTLWVNTAAGKANNVTVRAQSGRLLISDAGDALSATAPCTASGASVSCPVTGITQVAIDAGDLDDTVIYSASLPSYLAGGDGNDGLVGGPANDVFDGGLGNDRLEGGAGNDTVGSSKVDGADTFAGGPGTDTFSYDWRTTNVRASLDGVANDGLWSGHPAISRENDNIGVDVENLHGGFGGDVLTGNDAANQLAGDFGNDSLLGYGGADTVLGEGGDDQVVGNDGNDVLDGGMGLDALSGGEGNDLLRGDEDRDWLFGDGGNDRLEGGPGPHIDDTRQVYDTDELSGGDGTDVVDYSARDVHVRVDADDVADDGFVDEHDKVWLDVENIYGGSANDILTGNRARNGLFGFGGHDLLDVKDGVGNDTADGGVGSDVCYSDVGDARPNCEGPN